MTATLAAELATRGAHMQTVRAEYDHTKADHACADGCDVCDRGLDPNRILGWDYDLDADQLLCPSCAAERSRWKKQKAAAAAARQAECGRGHDMTDDSNVYLDRSEGRNRRRCIACRNLRNAARKKASS